MSERQKGSGLGILLFVALTKLGVVVIRQEIWEIPLPPHPVCVMKNNPQLLPSLKEMRGQ